MSIVLSELKEQKNLIKNINIKHQENLTRIEKFAVWITDNIGTMGFFFIVLIWTVLWILWNVFASTEYAFDPFPAFVLWLFISNMLQLFLLPLIMIGQNLHSRHAELRAESEYEINIRVAKETEAILINLEKQEELMLDILKKLEKRE